MKQKVKFFACLFFLVVWASGMEAVAAKKAKEYHESWPSNSVATLEISNKFGDVNVAYKGGSNVTVDVIITVESSNERKIDDLLEQISVSFSKTGNTVTAETHFSRGFSTRLQFSVDYKVNIPPDKNLNITNKYGNAFVNELTASGSFDISYGNFDANQLKAPADGLVELELAYGKGGVESANNLLVEVQYSTINFGNLGELDLDSKYSIINIDKAGSVIADSKYDTFNFGLVGALSSTTKYTRIKVRELSQKLIIDAGYGGIKVDKVDENFESVQITNSYGQISLGLGNANYLLDASCDYCGISYPESNFSGNRISERQMRKVNGKVGSGTGGTVFVKSRYGQINLD